MCHSRLKIILLSSVLLLSRVNAQAEISPNIIDSEKGDNISLNQERQSLIEDLALLSDDFFIKLLQKKQGVREGECIDQRCFSDLYRELRMELGHYQFAKERAISQKDNDPRAFLKARTTESNYRRMDNPKYYWSHFPLMELKQSLTGITGDKFSMSIDGVAFIDQNVILILSGIDYGEDAQSGDPWNWFFWEYQFDRADLYIIKNDQKGYIGWNMDDFRRQYIDLFPEMGIADGFFYYHQPYIKTKNDTYQLNESCAYRLGSRKPSMPITSSYAGRYRLTEYAAGYLEQWEEDGHNIFTVTYQNSDDQRITDQINRINVEEIEYPESFYWRAQNIHWHPEKPLFYFGTQDLDGRDIWRADLERAEVVKIIEGVKVREAWPINLLGAEVLFYIDSSGDVPQLTVAYQIDGLKSDITIEENQND